MENTGSFCIKNSKFARGRAEITSENNISISRFLLWYNFGDKLLYLSNELTIL
jgi:hypothetical protein